MTEIIYRNAADCFEAYLVAQGMQTSGADVFSIVWTGKENSKLAYAINESINIG